MGGVDGRVTYQDIQRKIREYNNQFNTPDAKIYTMVGGAVVKGLIGGYTNPLSLAYGMKTGADDAGLLYDMVAAPRKKIRYEDVYGPTASARRNYASQKRSLK